MKVRMLGDRVGVEQLRKTNKQAAYLEMPEDTHYLGIVRYLGEEVSSSSIEVGQKVFFGAKREPVVMNGKTILIMPTDNVVAIAEEESLEEETVS